MVLTLTGVGCCWIEERKLLLTNQRGMGTVWGPQTALALGFLFSFTDW